MASVNMLSLDDLLIIFNFLTLFDKLAAMRVCTTWYNIIKGTHAWKVINFFDKGPVKGPKKGHTHDRMVFKCFGKGSVDGQNDKRDFPSEGQNDRIDFPSDENTICEFLETFAGVGLQEVYLSFVSDKVMATLRKKCPNLETLSVNKALVRRYELKLYDLNAMSVEEIIYIPPKLRCLEISSDVVQNFFMSFIINDVKIYKSRDEQFFSLLGQCHNLRFISLTGFRLSDIGIKTLTASVRLKELDIINPVGYSDPGVSNRRAYIAVSRSTLLDAVLTASAESLSCLQRLRLDCDNKLKRRIRMLDGLPNCIALWNNLRVLALRGVRCSNESFEMMIPGLLNLDSLELEGNIVTSDIISMVGKTLKKVTYLELGNGHYADESLESLASHPSLEKLWIYKEYSNQSDLARTCKWLHTIYGVLTTLQKIKHVKMEGYRLIYFHSQEKFPVIKSAEIEIDNVEENTPFDGMSLTHD